MKLSISNIAWPSEDNKRMLPLIKGLGCDAIEIAPSRVWKEPIESTYRQRKEYLNLIKSHGLEIVSLHSLMYTRQDLNLFGSSDIQREMIRYIRELLVLARDVEARLLVFGSPNSRRRGLLNLNEAFEHAVDFFTPLAEYAEKLGICLLIEPLTKDESDFIFTSEQGLELVKLVNNRGFQLHLDAKAVANEDLEDTFKKALPYWKHFHANDPGLVEIASEATYHQEMGKKIKASGYSGFVSIEMKTLPFHHRVVENSIKNVQRYYF